MNQTQKIQTFSAEQPPQNNERKHSRRHRRKRSFVKKITRWIMENPLKLVAICCLGVLIYITVLFVLRSREERTLKGIPELRKSSALEVIMLHPLKLVNY